MGSQMRKLKGKLGGSFSANFAGTLSTPCTRIQLMHHAHDRNTGQRISRKNGALNGSRSAQAGQKRGMNVNPAKWDRRKKLIRNDAPKGNYHQNIRSTCNDFLDTIGSHASRLNNGKPQVMCCNLYGRRLCNLTSATNGVRPCNNLNNFMFCCQSRK